MRNVGVISSVFQAWLPTQAGFESVEVGSHNVRDALAVR